MQTPSNLAPGGPGIPARWTSSAKTGVGTAHTNKSRVWFTLSHGILNEIYYPRIDQACIRDLGLIVTDGVKFFSEEKRDAKHTVEWIADGVPAFHLVNTCRDGRYRIEKQIVSDPHRKTLLQQVRFHAQKGALSTYHLYVLLAPHLDKSRKREHSMTRGIEGDVSGVCTAERLFAGVGLFGSLDKEVGRLCRFVRWLAGLERTSPNDVGIHEG
jgi:GH15 family glucan-1,4-alpha-glucosidase